MIMVDYIDQSSCMGSRYSCHTRYGAGIILWHALEMDLHRLLIVFFFVSPVPQDLQTLTFT